MKTASRLPEPVKRLVGQGRFGDAAGVLGRLVGAPLRLALDLYEVYFPADDGRQDLVNWLDIRRRLMAPHRRALESARRRARALLSRSPEPEAAAILALYDLLLDDCEGAARRLEEKAGARPPASVDFLHALSLWLSAARARSRELMPRALGLIDRSLRGDPSNVYAYYVRAGLRRELEDVAGRLADAEAILRLRPDFVWAAVEKAETLAETKRFEEALSLLNELLKRHPDAGWAWAQRGRLYALYGRRAEAMADFDEAIKRDPKCGPLYAWRGELLRRDGDYEGAVGQFSKAVKLDPSYRLGFQWRGRVRLLLGRHAQALPDLKHALALEPREDLGRAWLAESYWKLGRCREAARQFDVLTPAEPRTAWNRSLRPGQKQELRYDLSSLPERDRREAEFWRDLDEVAARRPRDPWARAFRGRCRLAAGDLSAALSDLTCALQLEPTLAYALRWRGECLRRLGAPARAKADLDRCLSLAPKDAWALAFRGLLGSETGKTEAALRDFSAALAKDDFRLAIVHFWRSRCLAAAGRDEEARAAAEKAFVLDGKQPEIVAWRERLASRAGAAR